MSTGDPPWRRLTPPFKESFEKDLVARPAGEGATA